MAIARQVCPMCALDEHIVTMESESGDVELSCTACDYTWPVKPEAAAGIGRNGYAAELGVYEDLLACLPADSPWTEHGVIEHRFKARRPEVYAELVRTYRHHADGSNATFSASKFLAGAMGQLQREGLLVTKRAKPTGYWSYLSAVSYRARPPEPDWDGRLTWVAYAGAEGLDPTAWSIDNDGR